MIIVLYLLVLAAPVTRQAMQRQLAIGEAAWTQAGFSGVLA